MSFKNRCNNKDNLTFTIGLLFCSTELCFRDFFFSLSNDVSIDTSSIFSTDFTQQSNCIIAIKRIKIKSYK